MPSDESKGSQLDAIGSLAQRQLDNTLRSNDRWMLALVDTPLVPDAAGVERIGQQAVEVSATERQPSRPVPKLGPLEIADKSAA